MNREQLQGILRRPYNAGMWQELLINLFGASEIRQIPSTLTSDSNEKVEGFELGRLYTADRYEIGLFAFEIKQGHNVKLNRVGLRSLVHSYTRYNVDAALVVYYDATHWRLSFICDIKEQKTAPKRYTYVFGNSDESYRTASAMLARLLGEQKSTFEQIKAAFSVEALSKDFFKGYKKQYANFCKHIGGEEKWQRDYVKKMMGRLVFLQFLQKKGWMGVPANRNDWEGGDLQYTQNLVARYKDNDKLLSDVLEPLFFDTLNTKRENGIVDPKLGESVKIPYLNGGLFDKDKLDKKQIDFPYSYFAELMDFFSQYNFTIDENDPNDAEVGIDPEMLGHIFENLLEDNKDKGAFYTPKEIVQYMCRQSLIEYLQSKLGKHTEIENFINNHDTGNRLDNKNFIAQNAREIERLLDCVKICDPAIGSGAFPMGVLSEIFQAKMALNMTLDRAAVKKSIIQNSIYGVDIEQGAVDIARLRFWLSLVVDENEPQPLPNLDYKIMCGNSLLSRYELNMPFDDVFKEYNRGKSDADKMSLDRYRQLVTDYTNTSDHTQKANFRKTIEEIKRAFRTELSKGEKEKASKLKGQICTLETPMLFGERKKKEKEELKKLKTQLVKLEQEQTDIINNKLYEAAFEWRFEFPQLLDDVGNFVGFDIVIANPPYKILTKNNTDIKDLSVYMKDYSAIKKSNSKNIFTLFIELGVVKLLSKNGIISYIIPEGLFKTRSYEGCTSIMDNHGTTLNTVTFTNYVFENAVTGSLIFIYRKMIENVSTKKYHFDSEYILNEVIEEINPIIAKIERGSKSLKEIMDIFKGMVVQDRSNYIFEEQGANPNVFLLGKNISKWTIKSKYYTNYSTLNIIGGTKKLIKHNQVPRILIRRTGYTLCCSFLAEPALTESTLYSCWSKVAEIDNKYLLAILNSTLLDYYNKQLNITNQQGFPQILMTDLELLPIKIADNQQPFIEIVDKILEAKRINPTTDTSTLETEIDSMVYTLYNLTPDEIKIIEK